MNWYIAKLVFQVKCGNGAHSRFDNQLRLITAPDEKSALAKAKFLGTREVFSFMDEDDILVQWEFINVRELYFLADGDSADGVHILSEMEEPEDKDAFIYKIHDTALHIAAAVH